MKSKIVSRECILLSLAVVITSCQTTVLSEPSAKVMPTAVPSPGIAVSPMSSTAITSASERLVYVSRKNKWGIPFQSGDRVSLVYSDGKRIEVPRLLDQPLFPDRYLSISADGRYLAFNSEGEPYGPPRSKWYLADLDTQSLLTLPIENLEYQLNSGASWSPLKSEFVISLWPEYAVAQGNPRQGGGLFVLDASTLQRRRVTNNQSPAIRDTFPVWSPTGGVIAFLRCTKAPRAGTPATQDECQLYSVHPDGTELKPLANEVYVRATKKENYSSLYDIAYHAPAWSHDGQWLVFVANKGNAEIELIDIVTGETRLVAPDPSEDVHPTLSPDTDRIAFTTQRDGNDEIYTVATDGMGLTNMTQNLASDIMPVWSPTGDHIAFLSDRDSEGAGQYQLYVMDADGSNQIKIGGAYTFTQLTWSPVKQP